MSRARWFQTYQGDIIWFDQKSIATVDQLCLLSDMEGTSIDDLLDSGISQKEALFRLRKAKGEPSVMTHLHKTHSRISKTHYETRCRMSSVRKPSCEGPITRHHFVPRWLMRELDNYDSYSSRSSCTIPICVGHHRWLHIRGKGNKSVSSFLYRDERQMAHKMLDELKEERPKIYDLLIAGDEKRSYEARLIYDHAHGIMSTSR